jgi:D-sedoheptulose 7-phosphate isomerase
MIREELLEAQKVLAEFLADDENITRIEQAGALLVNALQQDGKILSCGNGGSMSDAMHFAEELSGRFRKDRPAYAALALSDPSYLTCVSNDYGYDQVFSRGVEALGRSGDVLLAISTSGNSANVLRAVGAAKEKGMKIIGLTGKTGGALAEACDVEIRAPHSDFSDRAQEIHIKVIHCLIHYVEQHVER